MLKDLFLHLCFLPHSVCWDLALHALQGWATQKFALTLVQDKSVKVYIGDVYLRQNAIHIHLLTNQYRVLQTNCDTVQSKDNSCQFPFLRIILHGRHIKLRQSRECFGFLPSCNRNINNGNVQGGKVWNKNLAIVLEDGLVDLLSRKRKRGQYQKSCRIF